MKVLLSCIDRIAYFEHGLIASDLYHVYLYPPPSPESTKLFLSGE